MIAPSTMTSAEVAKATYEQLVDAYLADGYTREKAEASATMLTDPPFPID